MARLSYQIVQRVCDKQFTKNKSAPWRHVWTAIYTTQFIPTEDVLDPVSELIKGELFFGEGMRLS